MAFSIQDGSQRAAENASRCGKEAKRRTQLGTQPRQRPSGLASAGRGELGSASTHRRSASPRAICSLRLLTSVGRHVVTHRLIVMPSAWIDRPPSVSIGVALEREFRPRCYDSILEGSVITARDAPGAMKDRVAQLCGVTGWPEIEQGPGLALRRRRQGGAHGN